MTDKHDEQLLGFSNLNKIFPIVDVVDNLNSDITNRPLSAKQGKALKEMINGITSFNYEVVTELPAVGQKGIIYLILNSASTEENNIYDEYLYVNDKYEKLGSFTTQIDLSQIKDELFYNFDINNALNRNTEDESTGTVKNEYYNKLLEAISNNKIITIGEIITNTIKHNTDDIGEFFVIEINFYSSELGTVVLYIKQDKTFIQKVRDDVYYLNVDSNYQSTWENINEIQQNQNKPIYIKFANGTCSPSLYTHVALHNFGKVYDFIYADNNGDLWRLGVTNPDNDTDKIQFNNEKIIKYADEYTPGNVLLGYKANGNNYPLQVDTEHRAFVNVTKEKYELDSSLLEDFKGTISVDKYNEILNAIKADKSIYLLGVLVSTISDESSISIYFNHTDLSGWLIINKTGTYYFIPNSIILERTSSGSFPIEGIRYLFEDKNLINQVNVKIADIDTVSANIIDYNKTSEAITFKFITGENFYYDCTLKNGSNYITYTTEGFYANNDSPGIIGIDYKQNGRNYPVQLDESHNAFVSVPDSISENRYDLDISIFSDEVGTISTDKYNEIANAAKDGKFIYISKTLVSCVAGDSSVTISVLGGAGGMTMVIKNTGEYIVIPKVIILTPGRYKLTPSARYVFEYEEYLKYCVDSIYYIDSNNNDNRYTVVIIKDYNKTSDSISFRLVLSNLYYYDCSIDLTLEHWYDLSIEESGYIYPTENGDDAGVISLGYTQNGKNYPLQINESGQAFVNVPWSGSTYNNATQTSDGLMSKEDKTKLDGLTGAATKILSQSEYDSLTNKGENTVYFIKG